MDFTVYSYGGAEILWKVFNSLAMLASSSYFYNLSVLMTGGALLTVAARAIPAASIPFLFKKWIMPTFFLMAFFWGPKVTINIVDHVDTNFKASQVANVPFGIAFAASITSKMSDVLTGVIEKFMTTSDMERYSQVGPMFGARLMYEARTLTIRDPIMRENLKDFTRQCYAWPYVFTNIAPGKKAAMESQDMLGFIEANAHKSLGMYWRYPDGQTEFMFCGKCAAKVREVIPLEVEMGFQSLARRLFGGTGDGISETQRLKQYFGNAWAYLAKGSSDAANVIQQELMLNSYRAALQDKREEFGLARNPSLSYLNAERGQIQQDESSLVKFALFGTQIPMLHSIFMAIALMFFVIVAPFTFTTGGVQLITTFAKVMLWLATWAPLSAILNALGHMYLGKATSGQLMGYGEGLNLMTQSGLADSAYHAYAFVMGLQLSIPAISWALLSGGGGYAMSQLSSSITQSSESFAVKAGAETVDGNVSFDSQTMHHKSVANTQLAQQQLSPNINSGSRIDDGTLATTYGQKKDGELDRNPTFQQHLTQLATNLAQNDTQSAVMALGSAMSYSAGITNSKRAGEQAQTGIQKMFSAMESLAHGEGLNKSFGGGENSNIGRSFQEVVNQVKKFAADNKISDASSFKIHFGGGISANPNLMSKVSSGGPFGALMGGLSAEAKANHMTSGNKLDDLSKQVSSDQLKGFSENLGNVITFMDENKGSITDNSALQHMAQAQESFNRSKVYSEEAAANFQQQSTFNESANISRQKGVSSTTNDNDSILSHVAKERFGGDMGAAAGWQTEHPGLYRQEAARYLDRAESNIRPAGIGSKASVDAGHHVNTQSIQSAPTFSESIEAKTEGLRHDRENLTVEVGDAKRVTENHQTFVKGAADRKLEIDGQYKEMEKKHALEDEKTTIGRAGKRLIS